MLIGTSDRTPHSMRAGRISKRASAASDSIGQSFAGLEAARGLLLAVSGGPDSMAMLLVAARWRGMLGGDAPSIHVATVDHGLRAESRTEAEQVAARAADLGLPHTILTWTKPKPSTRVQERAREARYALLADHARIVGATHVLTAHHADDQAETVLMRLGRGSGVAGLAGIRRSTSLAPGINLVRPFLGASKADLVVICRAEGCPYVDDPSNRNPAFARTRLRAGRDVIAGLGLDTPALQRLARRMARADAAIEAETDRVEAALTAQRGVGAYRVDLVVAGKLQAEIAMRLLGRAVAHVSGRTPRMERLESLAEAILCALDRAAGHRATIGGTRLVLGSDGWLTISAEPARRRGQMAGSAR